jgi:hypothetical protein
MFLDVNNRFPRWEPEQPSNKPPKRLTARQEKILMAAVLAYLFLTVIAPIGGSSILQAIAR